jgi:cytochrome P450
MHRFVKDVLNVFRLRYEPDVDRDFLHRFLAWRPDMLSIDPPNHTCLRGLVSTAFTPRMAEQLLPRIQHRTNSSTFCGHKTNR